MSLTEEFVRQLERKILTGEWKVGDSIPTLRTLSRDFSVSRSVVNAGIVELRNKGYIITVPRKGSIVADWKRDGTFAVLQGLVDNELYDLNFVSNVLDSRMTIECAAVTAAANNRTAVDLSHIEEAIAAETRAVTIDERAEADIAFHHAVAAASHNIVYVILLKSFEQMVRKLVTEFYQKNYDRSFVYTYHGKIYDAIKNGDAAARDYMRTLLKQGEDVVYKLYK